MSAHAKAIPLAGVRPPWSPGRAVGHGRAIRLGPGGRRALQVVSTTPNSARRRLRPWSPENSRPRRPAPMPSRGRVEGRQVDGLIQRLLEALRPDSTCWSTTPHTRDGLLPCAWKPRTGALVNRIFQSHRRFFSAPGCEPQAMLKGRRGRIINITSVSGLTGNAARRTTRAKAGVGSVSRSTAGRIRSRGITVNARGAGLHLPPR